MKKQNFAQVRMKDFRGVLSKAQLGGYLMTSSLEQRYVSGVELSDGEAVFLITPRQAYCFTKQLIVSKIQPPCPFIKVKAVAFGGMLDGALDFIKKQNIKRVAFAPEVVSLETGERLEKAGCIRAESLIGKMRLQKYEDEVAKLKKACKIAAQAFEEVKPKIKTGITEEEVRILIAMAMLKRGADSVPFNIVCFGANTADAHHTPSKRVNSKPKKPC